VVADISEQSTNSRNLARSQASKRKSTLINNDGRVNMDLFFEHDSDGNHRLNVTEAMALLKLALADMDLSVDWVTHEWMQQQFQLYDQVGKARLSKIKEVTQHGVTEGQLAFVTT